jgi:hypothetical protein
LSEEREEFVERALVAWNDYHSTSLHVTGEEADAWAGGPYLPSVDKCGAVDLALLS